MTPELAEALRDAGLWEAVLLDNAATGSKWRAEVEQLRDALRWAFSAIDPYDYGRPGEPGFARYESLKRMVAALGDGK